MSGRRWTLRGRSPKTHRSPGTAFYGVITTQCVLRGSGAPKIVSGRLSLSLSPGSISP